MIRLAILISGNGSNLQAIIDAIESNYLDAEIEIVISNNPDAYGLKRADQHFIDTEVIECSDYADRESFDLSIKNTLEVIDPDYIVLAGFMHILGADVVNAFENRIINIHPSLLPKFKGLNTYQRVLDAGEDKHGVTIHYVTPELDSGEMIMQVAYGINEGDTVKDLQATGQKIEHAILPQVLTWFAKDD